MNAVTLTEIQRRYPETPPTLGMGALALSSFRQILFNPFNLGFAVLMPVAMFLMFGVGQPYSDVPVANGNVAATVLISMTLFGAFLSTGSFAASVSLERVQGISRAYALTPLSSSAQLAARLLANVGVAGVIVLILFMVGVAVGAHMTWWAWVVSALLIAVVSVLASAMGFAVGFLLRSEGAFAGVSCILVLGAFGAGLTIPLEQMGQIFQDLAPWTPLWGAAQLVQLPVIGWGSFRIAMVVSVVIWTLFFATLAVWGLRRDTSR